MDENTLLNRISDAGCMINKEAADLILSMPDPEKTVENLLNSLDDSVFIITLAEVAALTPAAEGAAAESPGGGRDGTSAGGEKDTEGASDIPRVRYPFEENRVQILSDVSGRSESVAEYARYISYFRDRYTRIGEMIRSRISARPIESLRVAEGQKTLSRTAGNQEVSIIGLVSEKTETSNRHMIITLEDPTGSFPVLINKNDQALTEEAEKLILDEVVGITGNISADGGILMGSRIVHPDVPNSYSNRRTKGYAVFISDIHVGSKEFMKEEWEAFLKFLGGDVENKTLRRIASEIRYLVVAGDIVDGIGIYPGQYSDLEIPDIRGQYEEVARYFHKIPKNIHIVVAPGNHDAVRRAEPQTAFSARIQALFPKNVTFVGNPAAVSLDGVYVLMYHGCSMDDMVASIKGVSYEKPTTGMVEMVKRRHLAPTYGSRVMIAPEKKDYMIIDPVPDIIHCGHVHTVGIEKYKNILLINSGTWQAQTDFQRRVNIRPDPAKVPIVDLETLRPQFIDFNADDDRR